MKQIRTLRAYEIEERPGLVKPNGVSLLLYKDARVDMKLLDEVYGPMGWQRKHKLIGNNLYCEIQLYDSEKGQWITKEDVGCESFSDKEKGAASDSFKRACVNAGIGRELYSAPFIWIPADKAVIEPKDKKLIVKDRFYVSEIDYDDRRNIDHLAIVNQNGREVYRLLSQDSRGKNDREQRSYRYLAKKEIVMLENEMLRTGVGEEAICSRYHMSSIYDMTKAEFTKVMAALKVSSSKIA